MENPGPPTSSAVELISTDMFPVAHLSPCEKTSDLESNGIIETQFAPITPDKLEHNRACILSQQDQSSIELHSSQEWVENPISESLDTPEGNGGICIDLNKTPKKKKSRKNRLRPKLIKEGEQENFPKSTTPKQNHTKESTKPKKEYVRKTAGSKEDGTDGVNQCAKVKSCKRSLNFDLEGQVEENISKKKGKNICGEAVVGRSLNTDPQKLGEHPTRRQLLRANLKILTMLRDKQKEREKHGDSGKEDQHQMWQGYVPTLPRHNEGIRNKGSHVIGSKGTPKVLSECEKKDQLQMWQGYVPTPPRHNEGVGNNRSHVTGSKGTPSVAKMFKPLINDLVGRFKSLSITRDKVQRNKQNALDLFKGDNQMILYKPKPPRAEVALDMKTIKAWNLLMGIEAGEGVEEIDADKEKWWEEERRVFRKRVDSFMARMRIILGDRRFSPWSGSVVDSVVGVFLTQNVSDHLSSSAFMSVMARFPPKSTKNIHKRTDMRVEVPEEAVDNLENTNCCDTLSLKQVHIANAIGKVNWDDLRKEVYKRHGKKERNYDTMDSVDWDAVLHAKQSELAHAIEKRGQHNRLATKIQEFLKRLVDEHEEIDLEWLRDVHPDKAKEFLLSISGLGLKSVDCISLLNLHHHAFPVDTNIQRIAVRLGWAPLQPLPEGIRLHDLKDYPEMGNIQKYLWPRLYTLDQDRLYELHYQMITFGKVFCGKNKPNCKACPMRSECRHFASALASTTTSTVPTLANKTPSSSFSQLLIPPETNLPSETRIQMNVSEPIIEESTSPEFDFDEVPDIEDAWWQENTKDKCYQDPIIEEPTSPRLDIEEACSQKDTKDMCYEDPDEILLVKLNTNDFGVNSQNDEQENMDLQECDMSMILCLEGASIPRPKLKNVKRLRTEHQVYELPDDHPLLNKVERRILGDVCTYLLAILPSTDETTETNRPPQTCCDSQNLGNMCDNEESSPSCSTHKPNSGTVKGILLIPSKTTMRGCFPLNGTYFQVNEVFVDHASCLHPIDVPRKLLDSLKMQTVYCSTSIPSIFKGMTTEQVYNCFKTGYVCVRSFDRETRLPDPLKFPMHGSNSESPAKPKGKGTKSKPPAKTKGKGVVPESEASLPT